MFEEKLVQQLFTWSVTDPKPAKFGAKLVPFFLSIGSQLGRSCAPAFKQKRFAHAPAKFRSFTTCKDRSGLNQVRESESESFAHCIPGDVY